MSEREYIPHDMSWSAFRLANQCPAAWHARYVAKTYRPASTEAMAVGVWFHAAAMGHPTDAIEADFAELLATKTGKPTARFARAQACAQAFARIPYIRAMLSRFETEKALTVDLGGATWLCYIDLVDPDRRVILDIKYTADTDREQWVPRLKARGNAIAAGHYAYQLALYRAAAVAEYGGEPCKWTVGNMLVEPVEIRDRIDGGPAPGSIVPRIETYPYMRHELLDRYAYYMEQAWAESRPSLFREPVAVVPALRRMRDGEIPPPRCGACDWCVATQEEPRVVQYMELPEAD